MEAGVQLGPHLADVGAAVLELGRELLVDGLPSARRGGAEDVPETMDRRHLAVVVLQQADLTDDPRSGLVDVWTCRGRAHRVSSKSVVGAGMGGRPR
ncbi:hypothetical protein ACIO87_29610 [Streptomyces sp. NPDC087218]|uniref:hypothetical protein n=1 Tax=Streptomyces sp. NPDC087218 TaxID=3365769 RepID=UPI003801DE37